MSLLPSRDPAVPDPDPRVIAVDSDDADDVISALSAATARNLLSELHDEPAPPGELADRVDTSLQNAQYHLEKLESAGAVEVVDTAYSEKGREMDVYAPANQPLVICAGDDQETSGVRTALGKLLGSVSALVVASLVVQQAFGSALTSVLDGTVQRGSVGGGSVEASYLVNASSRSPSISSDAARIGARETTPEMVTQTGAAVSTGLPPGLAFFAGGLVVLLGLIAYSHLRG